MIVLWYLPSLLIPIVLCIYSLSHPGEKVLKCEICEKGYHTLPELDNHKRVHSKVGWVSCPVCDKQFVKKDRYHKITYNFLG